MKTQVGLGTHGFTEKPKGNHGAIKYDAVKHFQEMDIRKLAELNGSRGYTSVPGHLVGGIGSKNCVAMQLFVLDFDGGTTFEEVRKRCDEMGLKITYAYHTFSSTEEKEKFRVVFNHEYLLEVPFIIQTVLYMFQRIFPKCDRSCKNLDRMFYGGKELIYLEEDARFNLVQLPHLLMKSLDVGNHYQEKLKRFAKEAGVLLLNGNLCMGRVRDQDAICGEKVDPATIYIAGETTDSPFFVTKRGEYLHQSQTCGKKLSRIELRETDSGCRLFDDFEAGKDIGHEGCFAILTSLLHINGGQKHFLSKIRETRGESSIIKWEADIKYCRGYFPKKCSSDFCLYCGKECGGKKTILNAFQTNRRVYQKKGEYASLEEAEEHLAKNLEDAFTSRDAGIHLIRAQTGLGKTHAYIRYIREHPEERILIALSTNILKEEVWRKLVENGIPETDIFMTASIYGNPLIPEEIRRKISKAHSMGLHDKTKSIIREFYGMIRDSGKEAVLAECRRILEGLSGMEEKRIVLTSHAYFSLMKKELLENYTVVIDEDFLQLQVFNRMNSVSVECLKELAEKGIPCYSELAGRMIRAKPGKYERLSPAGYGVALSEKQLAEMASFGAGDNINDIIHAGSFVRSEDRNTGKGVVRYFCPLELPPLKYIILSATANVGIYRMYYKSRMEVYEYPEKQAAYRGTLHQYTYHSLGRGDLADKKQVFSIVKEIAGDPELEIISFKSSQLLQDMDGLNTYGIHYGNSTGINCLSGKDIGIVGTPYRVDEYYKLIACYLGADVNKKKDRRPSLRRVDYKGSNFLITTYDDKTIREIQLYTIESELEQCIGRARLLRNDSNVYLFSCFPCEQAQLHQEDYLSGNDDSPEENP